MSFSKVFGMPFDPDLFIKEMHDLPDPLKGALLDSGAMVKDALIESKLKDEGNIFSIPFYNELGGNPGNYDGVDNVTFTTITGDWQTGVAYGRHKGFNRKDFTADLAFEDPMGAIVRKIGGYWHKQRHATLLSVLTGIFGIEDMEDRIIPVDGKMGETTLSDVAIDTLGEAEGMYSLAIMHSQVAKTLANLELLEYRKGVDSGAYGRRVRIADALGFTVVIDDSVPAVVTPADGETPAFTTYSTYLLGQGVLRQANGSLQVPVETGRDPITTGGLDYIITRVRETMHPNGFSFTAPETSWTGSPTNAQLADPDNWALAHSLNAIPLAKITTIGG